MVTPGKIGSLDYVINLKKTRRQNHTSALKAQASPRILEGVEQGSRTSRQCHHLNIVCQQAGVLRRAYRGLSHSFNWSRMGSRRMRLPVAAKVALVRAGAAEGMPISPTPVGLSS